MVNIAFEFDVLAVIKLLFIVNVAKLPEEELLVVELPDEELDELLVVELPDEELDEDVDGH